MKSPALSIFLFVASLQLVMAQEQTPIFKDKKDSIAFATLDRQIKEYFKKENYNSDKKNIIDSLFLVQGKLRGRITGYRYTASPRYKTVGQLTPAEYATVTELSIANNDKIPAAVYELKNLKKLEFVNTSIKRIPKKLNRLEYLESLSIIKNSTPKRLRLGKNLHIKQLTIRSSKLPATYSQFKSLEKLNLAGNNLDKFPSLKGLKKLKDLNLSGNALVNIETANFGYATRLQNIELQGNKIEKIPASFGRLTELKKLMLNYNQVKEIDPACSTLRSLEQLGLYQNKLTSIPECLYKLESLKEIDLYYNQIEKLSEEAIQWKNLEVLYLSNNKLFSLPDNLGEMANLHELYLSNNRLSSLPKSISNLAKLKVLRANNNALLEAPNYLLKLNNIENIDFSSNSMNTFPIDVLSNPNLKIVVLRANPWDEQTKTSLLERAEELRSKGVVVHFENQVSAEAPESKK